jgi:hypothetical protein
LKIGEFGSFWGIYGCFLCKNVTVSFGLSILFGYGVMCFVSNRLGNNCKKMGHLLFKIHIRTSTSQIGKCLGIGVFFTEDIEVGFIELLKTWEKSIV